MSCRISFSEAYFAQQWQKSGRKDGEMNKKRNVKKNLSVRPKDLIVCEGGHCSGYSAILHCFFGIRSRRWWGTMWRQTRKGEKSPGARCHFR